MDTSKVIAYLKDNALALSALVVSILTFLHHVRSNRKTRELTESKANGASRISRIKAVIETYMNLTTGIPRQLSPGGQALMMAGIATLKDDSEMSEVIEAVLARGEKDPLSSYREGILKIGLFKFFTFASTIRQGEQYGGALKAFNLR